MRIIQKNELEKRADMEGWICLYRKILENPIICKDSDYLSVWIYLLLNATHKEIPALFKGEKIMYSFNFDNGIPPKCFSASTVASITVSTALFAPLFFKNKPPTIVPLTPKIVPQIIFLVNNYRN